MRSSLSRRGGRTFFERDQYVLGIVGTLIALLMMTAALGASHLPFLNDGRVYHAYFSDAGGLSTGDDVQVAGLAVGEVESVEVAGQKVAVRVKVTDADVRLGKATTARIVTVNVLGKKAVSLESRGAGDLVAGASFAQSIAPYDVTQALSGLTSTVQALDVSKISEALTSISDTFVDTPAEVTTALSSLDKVARSIASRDASLQRLLSSASSVTGVLSDRNEEISRLFRNGAQLLAELNARRDAIDGLLINATAVAQQLSGLVKDQQGRLAPALKQMRQTIQLLNRNRANIEESLGKLGQYATSLGEAIGSGPFFSAFVPNLSDPTTLPIFPQLLAEGLGAK